MYNCQEIGFWEQPLLDNWEHLLANKQAMKELMKFGSYQRKILQKLYKFRHTNNIWNVENHNIMTYTQANTEGSTLSIQMGANFWYYNLFHNKKLESALYQISKNSTYINNRSTNNTNQDSFDSINKRMKEVFSKLFGGGFAELALTEDDALNAGVVIMARPPGKKNSSISQLSGGEKALTALALVFAIFELNPAPFCILDEVDAPLDDLNTMRFINMVEEMSKTVQFIFITHNKVSMEKSDHLMGVTMQEAGVSRMVSVDVNQALEFAEA